MSFNIIELFPNQVDMSRFKKKDFKPGLISFEAIDPSKEIKELNQAIANLSGSFTSQEEEVQVQNVEPERKYPTGHFDVYNRNADMVTYSLEHGEKINKKI